MSNRNPAWSRLRALFVSSAVFLMLVGCGDVGSQDGKTITLGLIPAENNEDIIDRFESMRTHLEKVLGLPVKMFTATDYAGIVESMRRERVDVAWFGPLSYILAEQEANAEAFAVGVRKSGETTYRTCFVVPGDSLVTSLEDLAGKTAAFVDPASTSGGLMPSFMIKKSTGKLPQDFFSKLVYAGSHDAAGLAVKNKTVDCAVSSDITYAKMLKAGLITETSNRVLVSS